MERTMPHLNILMMGILLCLLCLQAEAAIEHFMVTSETDKTTADEAQNCGMLGQANADSGNIQEVLISFDDIQQNGIVDAKLLMTALLQQAQMLGLDISHLGVESSLLDSSTVPSCSAAEQLGYHQEQHHWYDVFFN